MWVSRMGRRRSRGGEVSGLFQAVGGLPEAKHLIYLLLLEKRYGGIDPEESEDAGEAVLYLHCALPFAICEILDKFWGYEGGRRAVLAGGHVLFVSCSLWLRIRSVCEILGDGPNPLYLLWRGGPYLAG
jgi:hypothetical protein